MTEVDSASTRPAAVSLLPGTSTAKTDGPVRQVTVRATSLDGSFTDQTFAITVTDVDEFDLGPISDAQPAAQRGIDENSTTAGTFTGSHQLLQLMPMRKTTL